MTQTPTVKILVLGSKSVGKSAITVRFLTKRYIGDYQSCIDVLYKKDLLSEDLSANIEILDVSNNSLRQEGRRTERGMEGEEDKDLGAQILWADSFVVVYSICDEASFAEAQEYLKSIASIRGAIASPIVLLGNKRDLEPGRAVGLKEGRGLALRYECQFYEISAADSYVGVLVAFEGVIREVSALRVRSHRPGSTSTQNSHRKLSIVSVTKVFGAVFGKNGSNSGAYFANIDFVNNNNNTSCCSNSHNNGHNNGQSFTLNTSNCNNENKPKRSVSALHSFCKTKKNPPATMVQLQRKPSPPILSL